MKRTLRSLGWNLLGGIRLVLPVPVGRRHFDANLHQAVLLLLIGFALSVASGLLFPTGPVSNVGSLINIETAGFAAFLLALYIVAAMQRAAWYMVAAVVVLAAAAPGEQLVSVALMQGALRAMKITPPLISGGAGISLYAVAYAVLILWIIVVSCRGMRLIFNVSGGRAAWLAIVFVAANLFFHMALLSAWRLVPERTAGLARQGYYADSEELLYQQPDLLSDAADALSAQRPGVVDLYFIGFAGSAAQDVFKREVKLVRGLFDRRFDTAGRSLTLINDLATAEETPIASVTALSWSLDWLAEIMDPEEDVLFLYLTSHGSPYAFDVNLAPLPLKSLRARRLRAMLDESGIKWRVIVISACYSGSFIDVLKDENSLIITAADAKHTSFGCQNGVDYTYWGKAYFDEALRRSFSFIDAFEPARESVSAREKAAGFEPSNPQIFVGKAIRNRLSILEDRIRANVATGN